MSHLSIALFGGFEAILDGQSITAFGTDKARALLAYLAIESGRPHRRDQLATLFWPESPAKKAAHNLSQTLLRLRRALHEETAPAHAAQQPFLLPSGQDVQFNLLSDFRLDVAVFQELIRSHRQHQHAHGDDCRVCVGWLQQAADLYRGDLLAGFALRDSVPFEEWLLVQQEALHQQLVATLALLVTHYERRGEPEQVQECARRLVALEPWQEQPQVKLMAALTHCGPVLERYGGQRQQRQGTECLIYFGYPSAYEDAPRRAVHAGLALVAAVRGADHVQIGIHTGIMVRDDDELVGDVPNLARDCQHLAEPGNVMVTADTARLLRGWFDCQVMGPRSLPGSADERLVYRRPTTAYARGLPGAAGPICTGETGRVGDRGSALGRPIHRGLAAVVPYTAQRLQADLATLWEADLIRRVSGGTRALYAFRHVLIQETAHASLLKRTRRIHHQHIAETYATRFPEIVEAQPEIVAEHYSQAGLRDQAADYWLRAGQRATAQGATLEARTFFERALASIEPHDYDRRWRALQGREDVLFLAGERAAEQVDISTRR